MQFILLYVFLSIRTTQSTDSVVSSVMNVHLNSLELNDVNLLEEHCTFMLIWFQISFLKHQLWNKKLSLSGSLLLILVFFNNYIMWQLHVEYHYPSNPKYFDISCWMPPSPSDFCIYSCKCCTYTIHFLQFCHVTNNL